MTDSTGTMIAALAILFLAGTVKGLVGLGLPAMSIGLLGLFMPPADAVALVTVPSVVSNAWQYFAGGPHKAALAVRLWPLLATCSLATLAGLWTGFLATDRGGAASTTIGAVLILYGTLGFTPLKISVRPERERVVGAVMGVFSGVLASISGVVMVPGVPFIEALKLRRDVLVQALGLFFLASNVVLMAGLSSIGILTTSLATLSSVALVPALAGMTLGQRLRRLIEPDLFRRVFYVALIVLGAHLALRRFL